MMNIDTNTDDRLSAYKSGDIRASVSKYRDILMAAGLLLLTFCAFNTILENDFIGFDDPLYVTHNTFVQQGFTGTSIRWAFSTFHTANWYPLTWLSHMLDVELYGLDAGGHHLTSLVIHLCNAVVLFGWLRFVTGSFWKSALAAALFAIHPLRVESVAWVAERKDVLSGFFGLVTLWMYVFYVRRTNVLRYFGVIIFLILGLMCKAMLVTWPILLLLLDIWPLKRWKGLTAVSGQPQAVSWTVLVMEKIPLAILSVIFSIVAFIAQRNENAVIPLQVISLPVRLANVFVSYVQYLGKTVYPIHLAIYYPYKPIWLITALLCFVIFGVLSGVAVWRVRHYPFLMAGWFWFVISLLPVIGLIQIGNQSLADRYTYIPSIGLSVAAVWFVGQMAQQSLFLRRAAIAVCIFCLVGLLVLTWRQTYYWKNSMTLFDRTLQITENNWVIEQNYAVDLEEAGRLNLAEKHALRAIEIVPDRSEAYMLLGVIYLRQDRLDEARMYLQKALQLNYTSPAETCYFLGLVCTRQKKYDQAREYLLRAKELQFDSKMVLYALADLYWDCGDRRTALDTWREILMLDSSQTQAMVHLAWNMATSADPNLADPPAALEYAIQAAEQTHYDSASVLDVLAAAYARQGDFDKAVKTIDLAIQKAQGKSLLDLIADMKKRKQCYENQKPWLQGG